METCTDDGTLDIRVEPGNITLRCEIGETVMHCAIRHGYYWPTICGGNGECGACRCQILEGNQNSGPVALAESTLARINPRLAAQGSQIRLACCLVPTGPMTILKKGVVPR